MKHEELTEKIIGAFFEVYNQLGYGFSEKIYEKAIIMTLKKLGLQLQSQLPVPIIFNGVKIGDCFPDLVVAEAVIVELKAVPEIVEAHKAQILSYMKAMGLEIGLILNFGPKAEFRRMILGEKGKEAKLRPPLHL